MSDWEAALPDDGWETATPESSYKTMADAETKQLEKRTKEAKAQFTKELEDKRFKLNAREGFKGTAAGIAMARAESGAPERAMIKDIESNPDMYKGTDMSKTLAELKARSDSKIQAFREKRKAELLEYMNLPDWYDDPTFLGNLEKMTKSLGGQVLGGLPSPENMVPVGKGKHAISTFLKGAGANAPIGGLSDLVNQMIDVEMGIKDKIDYNQVAMGTLVGAGIGGGMNVGSNHGRLFTEPPKTKAEAQAAKMRSRAEEPPPDIGDFKTGKAPAKEWETAEGPLPEIEPRFLEEPSLAERQAQTFKPEEPELRDLGFPEPDVVVQRTTPLPEIDQRFSPESLPEVEAPVRSLDESQAAFMDASEASQAPKTNFEPADIAYPKIERGFGPDVEINPLEDAPYLPGRLAEQANVDEMPGTHEMQFILNDGKDPALKPPKGSKKGLTKAGWSKKQGGGIGPEKGPDGSFIQEYVKKLPMLDRLRFARISNSNVLGDGMRSDDQQFYMDVLKNAKKAWETSTTPVDWNDPVQVADRAARGEYVPQHILDKHPALTDMLKAREAFKEPLSSTFPRAGEPGRIIKGPGDKQSGAIDPSAFSDGFKTIFGLNEKQKRHFEEKVMAHYSEFSHPSELANYIRDNGIEDIKLDGDLVMQNQLAVVSPKNKVVSHVFNFLFDRTRQSETRMNGYDDYTKDSLSWVRKNYDQAGPILRDIELMNAKPALRAVREALDGNRDAAIDYFVKKGYSKEAVDHVLKLRDVLDDVLVADRKFLEVHNRELDHEPFYWPLGRQGPYHILIHDDTGEVAFAGGYKSLSEARKAKEVFDQQSPEGWQVGDVIQSDPTRTLNAAMTEALLNRAPEWLKEAAMNQYQSRLEYRRNFELGRNTHKEVGGYLGEIRPEDNFKELTEDYLKAFSHRVRESHHLENASAAVEVARELMLDRDLLKDYPNTNTWLHTEISRQIGLDISAIPRFDRALQRTIEKADKLRVKLDAAFKGYTPGKNDQLVSAAAAKVLFQGWSYFTSLMKIGLSPVVIGANLAQNATIGMDGTRSAFRLGVSPVHAMKAQIQSLAYMMTMGKDPHYRDVAAQMDKARGEGMIDPHGREDYSAIENVRSDKLGSVTDFKSGIDYLAAVGDRAVQKPRDVVERMTNYNAILYYNFFVKSAFPDLDPKQHGAMVYNLSRSFTGDYSQHANLFAFEKAGTSGHLVSNFARWRFNRTSRYLDDIIMAAKVSEYGIRGAMPLIMSVGMGLVMAGVMGQIGLVEYEAFRRFGQNYGLFDWKPLSAILSESPVLKDMEGNARTMLERGALTALSDWTAQKFGEESGPDFSGSLRESNFFEIPTVAINTFGDVVGAGIKAGHNTAFSNKEVVKFIDSMPEGQMKDLMKWVGGDAMMGLKSDEMKSFARALPNVVQEAYKHAYINKQVEKDGKIKWMTQEARQDHGSFERTPFQEALAIGGGLKTTEENRFNEGKQYHKWLKRGSAKELTALKEGLEDNLDKPHLVDRNIKLILSEHGAGALEAFYKELEQKDIKESSDYFTLETMSTLKKRDSTDAQKALEKIRKALAVARPRTSTGH